jgi:hypothetical protein
MLLKKAIDTFSNFGSFIALSKEKLKVGKEKLKIIRVAVEKRVAPHKEQLNKYYRNVRNSFLFFFPGALLMASAVAVIAAPDILIGLISLLFLHLSVCAFFIGFKLLVLKGRFDNFIKGFQGRVMIMSSPEEFRSGQSNGVSMESLQDFREWAANLVSEEETQQEQPRRRVVEKKIIVH